jgi:hypothetical protein
MIWKKTPWKTRGGGNNIEKKGAGRQAGSNIAAFKSKKVTV